MKRRSGSKPSGEPSLLCSAHLQNIPWSWPGLCTHHLFNKYLKWLHISFFHFSKLPSVPVFKVFQLPPFSPFWLKTALFLSSRMLELVAQKQKERGEREQREAVERERQRRRQGQELSAARQRLQEDEMRRAAEERRREKAEETAARSGALQAVEAGGETGERVGSCRSPL